ncbi:MAG TPA: carbohydrate ABC transporter permease [Fimbriimonas sp.]|nr:carbohydrate ABC transporter permease [Fimbriimonas sp.]
MKRLRTVPIYVALLLVCTLFVFPFYWVIISALKSVHGLDLEPPAMYPAEQLTVKKTVSTANREFEADGSDWLRLARSDDLLGSGKHGAYYLHLDGEKPSQLVSWFGDSAVKPVRPKATEIKLDSVPVHEASGKRVAVVAKSVRQNDNGFDELLFTASPQEGALGDTQILKNVPHQEIRYFSAHFDNFAKALKGPEASIGTESSGFLLFMRNSLFIAVMAVVGQLFSSSLVAFGFARTRFKGRELLFIILIATLMVPAQVTLIPLFTIYKSLGWVDSFLPLIVPQFTAGAFNVFLMRQFMLGFPRELDESAEIDGASPWRTYRSIIFPNCTPVLIVVGLFTFVASWQDVLGPLIYLDNPKYRTVSLGLEYFRSPYVDNRPLLMAGAVLSMIPVAILFLVAQRYIMSGIATTGMKG